MRGVIAGSAKAVSAEGFRADIVVPLAQHNDHFNLPEFTTPFLTLLPASVCDDHFIFPPLKKSVNLRGV